MRISRRVQHVGVLALIVYIMMIGGATYSDTNVFVRGFHHILISSVFIGWLFHLIRQRRSLPGTVLDIPLLLYAIWLLITTATSLDWRVSLEQNWLYLTHVLGLYLLVDLMRGKAQRWLFEGLFLVAALVIVVSVVEFASWYFGLGFAGFTQNWLSIGSDLIPPYIYRLSLALNVSTWLGEFAVLVLPLVIAWALTARRRQDRQALWLVSLGLVWVLVFSQSRGAFLGIFGVMGVSLVLWLLHRYRLEPRRTAAVGIIVMALSAAAAALTIFLSTQQRSGADTGGSDIARRKLWEGSLAMIQDHPLTGVGVHQFNRALREYVVIDEHVAHLKSAHNLYLNTMAEIGVPGLLIMLWIGGAFGWLWWRLWLAAPPTHRIRLAAVLAGLSGFLVQSMVDNFGYTSTVLPLLIITAYVLIQQPVTPRPVAHWLPYAAVVGVLVYGIWLVRVDVGLFRHFQTLLAIQQGNYETALERNHQAQSIDPAYRLYNLQEAYILGVLADEDKAYLQPAIAAYETVLRSDPYFDIGYANLAALYAQQGEYQQAVAAIQHAATLNGINYHWLKLGDYQTAAGIDARDAYANAIWGTALMPYNSRYGNPMLMASAYWQTENPARQAVVESFYEVQISWRSILMGLQLGDQEAAARAVEQLNAPDSMEAYAALGYWSVAQGDLDAAAQFFEQALALGNTQGWLYAELAKIYLEQGYKEKAEQYARIALFVPGGTGAPAHAILIQLDPEMEPAEINQHLLSAVIPRALIQAYDSAVYGHLALLDYLPQLRLPGWGRDAYEPWFVLAERFAADDDEDSDPVKVYEAILHNDPYVEEARELCGTACD